jgi:hypothetical protein
MADMDIRTIVLLTVVISFVVIILLMALRIMFKVRKGSSAKKTKKTKVLKAVTPDTDSEMDSIFNSITTTKRIAGDLKRRGIDTSEAESLIKKAEAQYNLERESNAKTYIDDAKKMLLSSKKKWDEMTGFDIVPSSGATESKRAFRDSQDLIGSEISSETETRKPEDEFPELKKVVDKRPDNFLPSKFTISLAGKALEDAQAAGQDAQDAQRYLIQAKECFARDDFDEAFKLALCCKKEAEALLGFDTKKSSGEDKGISDLATLSSEAEELKICSICGNKKVAYICIETDSGEEATCRECYDSTMRKTIVPEMTPPPPPPPPPVETKPEKAVEDKMEQTTEDAHFCPNCGAKVTAEDVFCGKCGKPVKEELKCVGCGTPVEPGDTFCRKCGARLVT